MLPDRAIHQRLGEGGFIALVVSEAAIAEHVHDDIFVEQLAELDRDASAMHYRFRIVTVHVQNWRLYHQRNIRRIGRRTRISGGGGESDLVIDDKMHRAAGPETLGTRHGETFRHHALPRKGGVAM